MRLNLQNLRIYIKAAFIIACFAASGFVGGCGGQDSESNDNSDTERKVEVEKLQHNSDGAAFVIAPGFPLIVPPQVKEVCKDVKVLLKPKICLILGYL